MAAGPSSADQRFLRNSQDPQAQMSALIHEQSFAKHDLQNYWDQALLTGRHIHLRRVFEKRIPRNKLWLEKYPVIIIHQAHA